LASELLDNLGSHNIIVIFVVGLGGVVVIKVLILEFLQVKWSNPCTITIISVSVSIGSEYCSASGGIQCVGKTSKVGDGG